MKLNNCISLLENLGLRDLTVMSLGKSQEILESISSRFLNAGRKKEIITNSSFIDSDLLRRIYVNVLKNAKTYVYTAEKEIGQLVAVNARECLSKCLTVAKESIDKTCYIACCDLTYHFRIIYRKRTKTNDDAFLIEMSS